jgi:hypothetical protein
MLRHVETANTAASMRKCRAVRCMYHWYHNRTECIAILLPTSEHNNARKQMP